VSEAMNTRAGEPPEPAASSAPPPPPPPPPPPGTWGAPGAPGVGAVPAYAGAATIYEPAGAPLADYGRRLGGWLIDFAIMFVVGIILDVIFAAAHAPAAAAPLHVVIVLAYAGFLIGGTRGQTVGMMATNVKCVRDDGGDVTFWRAVGRGAFEYLLAILLFIPWVVDMLFPLWDEKNQTLHDKVAGTVVVVAQAR
jgi:uncharacterized RDD family membrane protein YckC